MTAAQQEQQGEHQQATTNNENLPSRRCSRNTISKRFHYCMTSACVKADMKRRENRGARSEGKRRPGVTSSHDYHSQEARTRHLSSGRTHFVAFPPSRYHLEKSGYCFRRRLYFVSGYWGANCWVPTNFISGHGAMPQIHI
jgi:hypothetical protein